MTLEQQRLLDQYRRRFREIISSRSAGRDAQNRTRSELRSDETRLRGDAQRRAWGFPPLTEPRPALLQYIPGETVH